MTNQRSKKTLSTQLEKLVARYIILERSVVRFIKRPIVRFKRALDYFRFGWSNPDWDHGYLHKLILFKLKRIQLYFRNAPYVKLSAEPEAGLNKAITYLEQYCEDDYYQYQNQHDEKWGTPNIEMIPIEDSDYFRLEIHRENVKTPDDQAQEKIEYLAAVERDENERAQDLAQAYQLILEHHQSWLE